MTSKYIENRVHLERDEDAEFKAKPCGQPQSALADKRRTHTFRP